MLKLEIYKKLKKSFPHLKNESLRAALDVFFDTIIEGVAENKLVIFREFGTFHREERPMPKENFKSFSTGEKASTFYYTKFQPSKILIERMNENV